MKLLIVDDEKLTREGLVSSIDWDSMGFDEVKTSHDGVHALDLCQTYRPDIILSDVRMPRMDGIRLAEEVLARWPDTVILFMSGYSDKEYLKAAIQLGAVNYVDKPIDPDELEAAIKKAIQQVDRKRQTARLEDISRSRTLNALAYALTSPDEIGEVKSDQFPFSPESMTSCFSIVIQIYDDGYYSIQRNAERIDSGLDGLFNRMKLQRLYTFREPTYVFHCFSKKEFTEQKMNYFSGLLTEELSHTVKKFHVVIGRVVEGYGELYHSFSTAIINLQQIFFQPLNTCLIYSHIPGRTHFEELKMLVSEDEFRHSLLEQDEKAALAFLSHTLDKLTGSDYILPNQARNLYLRLFDILESAGTSLHISRDNGLRSRDIWNEISSCPTIFELHQLILSATRDFFQSLEHTETQSSTIYMIENYIASQYSNPSLSIKAISDYVRLSSSYICTLFKEKTGTTLNQYITEYRMYRAKELLSDPRNRISEISENVGYNDSNYFSKLFKKTFGLSPSEFRESL
ncbi:MAG: response regulator [Lachnospiraceae bacterium]|nr:response regulator [Lachnospiraceae bacterium]